MTRLQHYSSSVFLLRCFTCTSDAVLELFCVCVFIYKSKYHVHCQIISY
uniref:Uncharacterized protein n=1 Tax=Anguilla anguilla TaxID=7936 RepID=A0A0E9Q721_ANGAN